MRANRLRLRVASMAYVLLRTLRRLGLARARLAAAACGSLCLKPLKIAAWVCIEIAMGTNHPFQGEFRAARRRLSTAAT